MGTICAVSIGIAFILIKWSCVFPYDIHSAQRLAAARIEKYAAQAGHHLSDYLINSAIDPNDPLCFHFGFISKTGKQPSYGARVSPCGEIVVNGENGG
jgi:hypothetical protein